MINACWIIVCILRPYRIKGLSKYVLVLEHYIVGTALDYACGGYQRKLCVFLKLGYGQTAAVAHGGSDLAESKGYIVLEASGIGYQGIYTLFKAEVGAASQIIALPVAGS